MDDAGATRERIRAWRAANGRRIAVLDDDPTGSQSVHDVQVVTVLSNEEISSALHEPGSVSFVLTNTRGLPEADAIELNRALATSLHGVDPDLDIVSRSDSTLRGHVLAEIRALDARHAELTGRHYDGVLLAPAFFEAGRFTSGDVHFATITGIPVPVGETEFARDATFGYSSSDLRDFVAERSGGTISRDEVLSISLETIAAGPEAVRDVLLKARDLAVVVVNATGYEHFETVVLGVQAAIDAGRSFLYRTGPSFVRSLAGLEPRAPLAAADFPQLAANPRHGLVVVGSHVSQTSRQVAAAQAAGGLVEFELDVAKILEGDTDYLDRAITEVRAALERDDVLLYTSRTFMAGDDAETSLDIARAVSAAVSTVVAGALAARPAWVIAKGGITSHDVAVHGLGIRRARVLGQLLPGMISVFEPLAASHEMVGVPYVVFAGNVGDDGTLAHIVSVLRSAQEAHA
jgi:uncharacterized protein YgbK (DUF1537 family)